MSVEKAEKSATATTVPVPPFPVEGAGFLHFDNYRLLSFVFGVPLALNIALPISLSWYPFLFALLAVPTFCLFNFVYVRLVNVPRQKLPNNPPSDYIEFHDEELKQLYSNSKIPMETFFEAYIDGKVSFKGDVFKAMEARHDWANFYFTASQAKFLLTQWVPETLTHSRKQDEDQVRDHYDRGDDFYEAFLGPMMVYTSGIVNDTESFESLEKLQENKINLVLDKIHAKEGDRLLDIGCGWGTLAYYAGKRGANVTGVTLGRNQAQWGMKKAEENNVADKVRILCMDYRDIPREKYSKITCLEMAEHVGVRKFQEFLIQVREMLEDDGIFFLQIAGLRRAWQYEDLTWGLFMAKYIFPGADASCPLNWVLEQLERAGFEVQSVDTIGVHYSATIYRWYLNWMKNRDAMEAKYGKRWVRIWEIFLSWSTIVARQGSATCYQIVSHKNRNALDRLRYFKTKRLVA